MDCGIRHLPLSSVGTTLFCCVILLHMVREKRGMDFVRNKIKGKIADIIFQHIFAENYLATIIPFGYEHIAPMLAQYQHLL